MTIVGLLKMPDRATKWLDEVIRHHRDRDDFPIFFRAFYVLQNEQYAPKQQAYDSAIVLLKASIESAPSQLVQALIEATQKFNTIGFLPPGAVESLENVDEPERQAHAWAAYYIYATFSSLGPYLDPEVPPQSRLLETYPEISALLTPRDRLLPVGQAIAPGYAWVTYKGHDVHLHPGLRRGFHSRVHYELVRLLWGQLREGNDVSIAVDHFRFCPRGELRCVAELDAWFGAPFAINDVDDPLKVGATVHGRSRSLGPNEPERLLTEFRWTYSDGLKSLEIEELPPPEAVVATGQPVICRFVHSIREIKTARFIHLDGALTIYENDKYGQRYEQATKHRASKVWAERKVKLFRVDAPKGDSTAKIDENAWTELVVSFFRGNELVLEYFDGRSFAEIYRDRYGFEYPYWDD